MQRAKMASNLYQEFSDIGRIMIVHNAKINYKPLKAIHAIRCVKFEWWLCLSTFKSYHYSVNYIAEFHFVTKIQILMVYFPASKVPFHEYWWRTSKTVLIAHVRGKSCVRYCMPNYISHLIFNTKAVWFDFM